MHRVWYVIFVFFFFKQKTAYEIKECDWSSDVCSSDLGELFELIRPVVVVISILLSACVLASARKRFSTSVALAWTMGTLFLPLIVLPVYLAVILVWRRPVRARRWRFVMPLVYAAMLLAAVGLFVYHDSQTVDAHLARAAQAKLLEDHATAIREYHRALALEDNAHTHKLLGIELATDG